MTAERPQPEIDREISKGYGTGLERLLLGDNSITGTFRLVLYMLGFVLIFGTLFYVLG